MKVSCIAKKPAKQRVYSQSLFDGVGPVHRTCAQCVYFRRGNGVNTLMSHLDNGRCRGMQLRWQDDEGCSDVFTFGNHSACPLFQVGFMEYSDDA